MEKMQSTYERIAKRFPGHVVSEHDLIVGELLTKRKNSYPLNLREGNNNTDHALDILLNDNDAFVVTHIGAYVVKQDAGNGRYGNFQRFTCPDPQYFVGAAVGTSPVEWAALLCLWNGTLSFKTGNTTRIKTLSMLNFLRVPEQQVAKQAAPLINDGLLQFGGAEFEMQGMKTYTPTILVDGAAANEIRIELAEGDIENIGTENRVEVRLHGFLIEGGAKSAKQFNGWE